jgi:hypothetical protein
VRLHHRACTGLTTAGYGGAVSHRSSAAKPRGIFIVINIYYRHLTIYAGGGSPAEAGAITPRRQDFTLATHCTPDSRSVAVAGGGRGREVAVQLARPDYRVFGIARNYKDIAEVQVASPNANGQHRGSSARGGCGHNCYMPIYILTCDLGGRSLAVWQLPAGGVQAHHSTPLPVILRPRGTGVVESAGSAVDDVAPEELHPRNRHSGFEAYQS